MFFLSIQLEYLANLCSHELNDIEREFQNDGVELHIRQNLFYAPQYWKNEIQSRVKSLLSNLKIHTFQSMEFYYDIADRLCLNIKRIAAKDHCYCEFKLKTKIKSYQIPKSNEKISIISKSISEQSNSFCSSPFVFCRSRIAHGSIDVFIGDIALQKVNLIILELSA